MSLCCPLLPALPEPPPPACWDEGEVCSRAPAAAGSGTFGLFYFYALGVINTQQKVISSEEILFKDCQEMILLKC